MHAGIVIGLLMLGQAFGQDLPSMTEADMVKDLQGWSSTRKVPTFAQLATLPPEDVWWAYVGFSRGWRQSYPEVVHEASLSIAKNAAVGPWVDEQLVKIPYDNRGTYRTRYLLALGTVPAAWSARILGKYLFDDRKFTVYRTDMDTGNGPSPPLAAFGLATMGFFDGPTEGRPYGDISKDEIVRRWQTWWKANEGRIEERIHEINPDLAATPTPKPTATFPVAKLAIAPTVSPSQPPILETKAPSANLPIIPLVIFIGVLTGVAVFFLPRK